MPKSWIRLATGCVSRLRDRRYSYLLVRTHAYKRYKPLERAISKDRNSELKHPLPSPTSNAPGEEACLLPSSCYSVRLTRVKSSQAKVRNRKRSHEDKTTLLSTPTPSQKRPRASPLQYLIPDPPSRFPEKKPSRKAFAFLPIQ